MLVLVGTRWLGLAHNVHNRYAPGRTRHPILAEHCPAAWLVSPSIAHQGRLTDAPRRSSACPSAGRSCRCAPAERGCALAGPPAHPRRAHSPAEWPVRGCESPAAGVRLSSPVAVLSCSLYSHRSTVGGGGGSCGQGASNPIAKKNGRKIAGKLRENCGAVIQPPEASRSNTSAQGTHGAPTSTSRGHAKSNCRKIAEICRRQSPPPAVVQNRPRCHLIGLSDRLERLRSSAVMPLMHELKEPGSFRRQDRVFPGTGVSVTLRAGRGCEGYRVTSPWRPELTRATYLTTLMGAQYWVGIGAVPKEKRKRKRFVTPTETNVYRGALCFMVMGPSQLQRLAVGGSWPLVGRWLAVGGPWGLCP